MKGLHLAATPYQLIAAGVLGLVLGLVSLQLSPLWAMLGIVAVCWGVAIVARPELGLLSILVATSTVVYENALPLLPIGVGSLNLADSVLLGLFGLILIRKLVEPRFGFLKSPLTLPMLVFYGVAVIAAVVGVSQGTTTPVPAFREIRVLTYYLSFFVVISLVRSVPRALFLARGVIALATIVSVAMIAQAYLGDSVQILPGRVETLGTADEVYAGVTRILPPGQSMVQMGLIVVAASIVLGRFRPAKVFEMGQLLLLAVAVLFTFNRNFWVGAGLALTLLAFLAGRRARQRLFTWMAFLLVIAGIFVMATLDDTGSPIVRTGEAVLNRAGTLGDSSTLSESSLQFRYVEYDYAIPQVLSHPIFGLGPGAQYRPLVTGVDYDKFDGRAYIHNAHLWILMKTGLLGYLAFLWLSFTFLYRGLRYWRQVPNPELRVFVLGFTLTYVGVMVGTIVDPMFMQWFWTPLIGIMMGISEAALSTIPARVLGAVQATRTEGGVPTLRQAVEAEG